MRQFKGARMRQMTACLLLLLWATVASAQSVPFSDNFNNGDALYFEDHAPSTAGIGWEKTVDSCSSLTVPFQLYGGANGKVAVPSKDSANAPSSPFHRTDGLLWSNPWQCRRLFRAETSTPLSPNTVVQVTMRELNDSSSADFWFLLARCTGPQTCYGAGWYHGSLNPDCYIFKIVDGAYTQLKAGNCELMTDGRVMALRVEGDQLTLSKDGVVKVTVAGGSAITEAGTGGWGAGNIRTASDRWTDGESLDDFTITDLGGFVAPPLPPPTFTSTCDPATLPLQSGAVIDLPPISCDPGESFTVSQP